MNNKQFAIEELKKIISPIAKKYHISKVYLFGSYARGDCDEQSDVDLRIEKGELRGILSNFYGSLLPSSNNKTSEPP